MGESPLEPLPHANRCVRIDRRTFISSKFHLHYTHSDIFASIIFDMQSHSHNYKEVLNQDYEFCADDMNFSKYSNEQLVYLCDHRLFVRSRYPKLAYSLLHNPNLTKWIHSTPTAASMTESEKVACVVNAIKAYSTNFKGELKHNKIHLQDSRFWQYLVDAFWKYSETSEIRTVTKSQPITVDEHEKQVIRRVNHTLKPYRYWKDTEVLSNSTRTDTPVEAKRNKQNTTRKKTRSIWIH